MDKNKTIEKWKNVKGYEGYYQVSNLGRIRSLDWVTNHNYGGKKRKSGVILKPVKQKTGYLTVNLSVLGERKTVLVHRLVAISFLCNPNGKPHVNHKNGIRHDNRASQLEWVTVSENELHAYKILGKVSGRMKPVKQICQKTGKVIRLFKSQTEAANILGITSRGISDAVNGGRKTSGGWRFE
jgi:hypothetical protein